ncbi:aspartate kinase [Haliangium sp.]|uniref:aspartate kinase n=1 Tax=Haliangium sp. TaxID=2663208 RepID=UPI003D0CF1C9
MSTAISVHKYGGSSLATTEKLEHVAEKLIAAHHTGAGVAAVVSATGDTTDTLLGRARAVNDHPEQRELDLLLSAGEQISSALVAMAIQRRGVDAVALTGRQCQIITCGTHGRARIVEVRPDRVRHELAQGRIVVAAGYQGISPEGELTTLGRGGSDTSAIALADALDARACEIYSDVDGVYSADPRLVPDARRLEHIGYDAMLELSRLGARVLNAQGVAFARTRGVLIHARSTFSDAPGTLIGEVTADPEAGSEAAPRTRAVAGWDDVLRIHGRHLAHREIRAAVEGHEILLDQGSAADAYVDLYVSGENIPDTRCFASALRREFGEPLPVSTGLGMVSVVGADMGSDTALTRARMSLRDAEIAVLASASTERSLLCAVPASNLTRGLRLLHRTFVEAAALTRHAA